MTNKVASINSLFCSRQANSVPDDAQPTSSISCRPFGWLAGSLVERTPPAQLTSSANAPFLTYTHNCIHNPWLRACHSGPVRRLACLQGCMAWRQGPLSSLPSPLLACLRTTMEPFGIPPVRFLSWCCHGTHTHRRRAAWSAQIGPDKAWRLLCPPQRMEQVMKAICPSILAPPRPSPLHSPPTLLLGRGSSPSRLSSASQVMPDSSPPYSTSLPLPDSGRVVNLCQTTQSRPKIPQKGK